VLAFQICPHGQVKTDGHLQAQIVVSNICGELQAVKAVQPQVALTAVVPQMQVGLTLHRQSQVGAPTH
jgi:hypothetical protein